ncbi:hypothetical protein SAMN05421823_103325 [Catalinimonas alkaloidigena]|uniref:Uncharacterized protein n=1 Tax=Catalinimonas alkaloidigena TaxID=1075417 RepID=A0A1G9E1Z8_9BACT|nr:hypothetical protein SAMN05421823_103325 [Catalinimonas alkaloidigena]
MELYFQDNNFVTVPRTQYRQYITFGKGPWG